MLKHNAFMKIINHVATGMVLAGLLLPAVALAHPGDEPVSPARGGFAAGLFHPLSGLDHLLAMLAVGMWAAQIGGRAVWIVPSAFVVTMLFGGALGIQQVAVPSVELGIAASVAVLGCVVAGAFRVPAAVAAAVVGLFALFHGHAHGTELAAGLSGLEYGAGFALTSACLHAAGIALTDSLRTRAPAFAVRYAGGAIAACGVAFCVGLLFNAV